MAAVRAGMGPLEMMEYYKKNIYYNNKRAPSSMLNALFMSTVNAASRTLASVASNIQPADPYSGDRWRPTDHLRFMVMLMSWLTVWVMRVLMDFLPVPSITWSPVSSLLSAAISPLKLALPSAASAAVGPTVLAAPFSSSAAVGKLMGDGYNYSTAIVPASSMDLVLQDGLDETSLHAIGRSLTDILALLNEIPATSRKYQFAMTMADRIMDGNFRHGHPELVEINRIALSSSFARTLTLLYRSIQEPTFNPDSASSWAARVVRAFPMGSLAVSTARGLNYCLTTFLQTIGSGAWSDNRLALPAGVGGTGTTEIARGREDVMSEKLAEELLWMTNKLRMYGFVEEALVQWSHASGLASIALTNTISPRVQGLILKTSAVLIGDLGGGRDATLQVSGQVKSRLLMVWLPVLCHANNGLAYPVLSTFEMLEVERAIDEVMSTLPGMDQEVILTNWVHDYAITSSEWPNLQSSYDRWCQSTRQLAA
ncbi:hypothetical protein LINGRAHAP2_LOCUS25605 [Linum grandiflorum]